MKEVLAKKKRYIVIPYHELIQTNNDTLDLKMLVLFRC